MEARQMTKDYGRLIFGGALVLIGLLFLLQNFNVFYAGWGEMWGIVWGVAFIVGGAAFVGMYVSDRRNWWPLIPGLALIAIGITTLVNVLLPGQFAEATGGLFLGMIGVAFLIVYLTNRQNWWAIIPAGVMITLGVVAAMSPYVVGEAAGSIFFFGLAITFAALYLLPSTMGRTRWAIWPAVVMAALGLITLIGSSMSGAFVWALILIGVGGLLLYRFFRPARS